MRLRFLKPTLIGDCSYDAGTVADVDVPENVLRDNLIPSGACRLATSKDAEPAKGAAKAEDNPPPRKETAAQKKKRLAAEKAAAEKASEEATVIDAQESDEPDADDSADA